jgi:hypothetical protein
MDTPDSGWLQKIHSLIYFARNFGAPRWGQGRELFSLLSQLQDGGYRGCSPLLTLPGQRQGEFNLSRGCSPPEWQFSDFVGTQFLQCSSCWGVTGGSGARRTGTSAATSSAAPATSVVRV